MRISDWSSDVCSSDLAIGDHAERTDDRREDVIPQKIEQLPHAALISAAPVFARYTIASSEEGVIGPSARLRREGDAERALALLFLLLGRRAGCGAAAHAAEIGADHQRAVRAEADFRGPVDIPRRLARGLGRIGEMHLRPKGVEVAEQHLARGLFDRGGIWQL